MVVGAPSWVWEGQNQEEVALEGRNPFLKGVVGAAWGTGLEPGLH